MAEEQCDRHNERAWLAWHIAALNRSNRFPKLEKLMQRQAKPKQNWQQQLEIARTWVMAMGGEIVTRKKKAD